MKTKNDCFSVIRHPLKEGRRMRNSDNCNLSRGIQENMSPHTSMWILTLTSPCDVPASVQGPRVKTETPINHCPSSQLGALLSLYSPFQTKHPIRSNTVQDVTTIHTC